MAFVRVDNKVKVSIPLINDKALKLCVMLKSTDVYEVCCFSDTNSFKWGQNKDSGLPVLSPAKVVEMYNNGKINKIVVPSMDEKFNLKIYNMFLMYGLAKEDILYVSNKSFCEENIIVDDDSYISSFEERRELETIEIHVAEHCNCSCKNCSMFCALVKQESFPVYSEFEEGLKNLKKYFDHVKTIRIIGGEPLLNPELYKYIDFIGEIFPFSDLRLLSNGILADKMDDRLIESIKRNKVRLFISNYIPVSYKMDKVKAFLDAKEIKNYIITDVITEFQKIYDYRGAADKKVNFDNCHWKNSCATLYGSEMSVCFVPFVIHYLSDSFNLSIEEQKKIDLTSDNLTTGIIRKLMNEPMDVCRYCSMYRISEKWDLANKKEHTLNINDWSV